MSRKPGENPLRLPVQPAGPLRWVVLGTAALVVFQAADGPTPWFLTAILLLAIPAVYVLPASTLRHPRFGLTLFLIDVILVTLAMIATVAGEAALIGSFFLGMLIAVLAAGSPGWMLAGLAVPGLYLALSRSSLGPTELLGFEFLSRILFLLASSYYSLLEIARLNDATRTLQSAARLSRELWTLLQITETITGSLDLREVMRRVVEHVGELVGAENCSVLLADPRLRNCVVVASNEAPDVDMLEVDLEKYPELRRALETREPVVVHDVENDPLVSSVRNVLIEKGYRSMLVLPLLFGDEVLGTLFLRASRGRAFTDQEMQFCRVAAGASANALKNAALYREVSREAERHRATGETLRRVLDCSPDMIVATDNEGNVTDFNGGAERIIGVLADEACGRPLADLLGTHAVSTPSREGDDGILRRDVVLNADDGEPLELSLVSAPLTGFRGERSGRVWVGRDMTHVRRVERSLAQAERLSTLGEIVAGVAHELNNPLSAVLGYSELLRKNEESEEALHDLERVVDGARRCKRIVQNLLSFARKHPPEKKFEDLNSCVRKVVDLKAYNLRAGRIRIEFELDPDLPATLFDYHQIEQVVINLLSNAEQALRDEDRERTIRLRTYRRGESIFLEVEDSGEGVPEEIRCRVFDPFFTTKEVGHGTGLGLSLAFGVLQEHDGGLELLPGRPGCGACFRLRLPIVAAPVESELPETAGEPASGRPLRGRRILVAEDEPMVLDLFSRVLEQEGASVTRARDGEEAWDKLVGAEYDLVVADLRMPRMDGQELYERVAELRPELLRRFVFSTGDLMRQESVEFLESLPNGILTKPLQVETVRHVLTRTLRKLAG